MTKPGPAQVELSDADWKRLRRLSGLPEEARPSIADVIGFLRRKPALQKPQEPLVLKNRAAISSAIEKGLPDGIRVLQTLIDLRADRLMIRPLLSGEDATGVYVNPDELENVRDYLKEYAEMLSRYWPRLLSGGGRKKEHRNKALHRLHRIALKFTGSAMNTAKRQGRDWVTFVSELLKVSGMKGPKEKDIELATIAKEIKETKPL